MSYLIVFNGDFRHDNTRNLLNKGFLTPPNRQDPAGDEPADEGSNLPEANPLHPSTLQQLPPQLARVILRRVTIAAGGGVPRPPSHRRRPATARRRIDGARPQRSARPGRGKYSAPKPTPTGGVGLC